MRWTNLKQIRRQEHETTARQEQRLLLQGYTKVYEHLDEVGWVYNGQHAAHVIARQQTSK